MSAAPLAFVISPQPWAGFHVSKHHYAIALAERGWRVVFVDPPTELGAPGSIELTETDVPSLASMRYQVSFPYGLKFHARWAFDAMMRRQARRLVEVAGQPDLVWDFDNAYQFRDLRVFGAQKTLFHLVDDVSSPGMGTKRSDHFLYLHRSFAKTAGGLPLPDHEVGHGLGELHAIAAKRADPNAPRHSGPVHVGFVGNLAAPWLDWPAVRRMVDRHPEAKFTFWGPLPRSEVIEPALADLISHNSIRFPGLCSQASILSEAATVDVWLMPFRADKLPGGKALNSHKILEYLSTGSVVVMDRLEAYEGNSLVQMPPISENIGIVDVLDRVLKDLDGFNSSIMMRRRREFALERTYDRHLDRILTLIGWPRPAPSHAA